MSLRVVHFHFGKEGGAERFFVNLARALHERGVEQQFFIRPNRSWDGDVAALGPVFRNNFSNLSPLTLLAHLQAEMLVRRWKPNAVMAWMPRAGRLIHRWPNTVKLARMGDFPANLKHFQKCDILVGNLPGISNRCIELGWTKPVVTVSNFTREASASMSQLNIKRTSKNDFVIAASGRLVARKGFDVLIKALARLENCTLWLMGDGEERARLEAIAAELGISQRVVFLGWVDEPMNYIALADVFVMPSRHEPLGNALLEAWEMRIPTISTRSEGPSWYMRDQVDGILTDIDDDAQIAEAIEFIRTNKLAAESFVKNATLRLSEFFSKEAVVDAYIDIFRGKPHVS